MFFIFIGNKKKTWDIDNIGKTNFSQTNKCNMSHKFFGSSIIFAALMIFSCKCKDHKHQTDEHLTHEFVAVEGTLSSMFLKILHLMSTKSEL